MEAIYLAIIIVLRGHVHVCMCCANVPTHFMILSAKFVPRERDHRTFCNEIQKYTLGWARATPSSELCPLGDGVVPDGFKLDFSADSYCWIEKKVRTCQGLKQKENSLLAFHQNWASTGNER